MNIAELVSRLPWLRGVASNRPQLIDAAAQRAQNDVIPRDTGRPWREEAFKTETKKDYIELYERHVWYYSSIYAKAMALAQRPIKVYILDGAGKRQGELNDGAIYNLIHKPNPIDSKLDFMESLVSYLELTGDSFIEKNDPVTPTQLYVLRPDFVEIVTDPKVLVKKYIYKPDGVPSATFEPNEIVHIRYFHPRSEIYGFSFAQATRNSAILDFSAIEFQKNFFKKGGAIDKFVSVKSKLSGTEYNKAKEEIRTQYSGVKNAHEIMLLDDEGQLKAIAADFNKILLKEQRDLNRDEIFSGAGVPPIMANLLAGNETYNNAQTQERAFWQNSIIPVARKIEGKLNSEIFWRLRHEIEFDFSDIVALQEDALKQAQTAVALVQGGVMTTDEVRERFYQLKPNPVATANAEAAKQQAMFNSGFQKAEKKAKSIAKAKEAKTFWEAQTKDREKQVFDGVKPIFKSMSDTLTSAVRTNIKKAAGGWSPEEIAGLLDEESADMADELLSQYEAGLVKSVGDNYRRIKGEPMNKTGIENVTSRMKSQIDDWAENSTDSIVETMSKRTSAFLTDAVENDMPLEDIVSGIQDIFEGDDREEYPWARAIARTETSKIMGSSSVESMKEAGFTSKTWIAGGPEFDAKGNRIDREDHTAMDGMTIGIDESFVLPNGNKMAFPGDPEAEVGELVNCRCLVTEGAEDIG